MPVDEVYRKAILEKLTKIEELVKEKVWRFVREIDEEDLEYGVSEEITLEGLGELWEEGVEKNNYLEIVSTEIMEHHDGAYLKAIFRNSLKSAYADRYISIWSSGKVDTSHAMLLKIDDLSLRIERVKGDTFKLFLKK